MSGRLGDDGYVVVKGFLDGRMADTLLKVLLLRQWRGQFKRDDQVPNALSHWGDSTLDALLLSLEPDVEAISACRIIPTYAYARLYLNGDALHRHRDRAACEIAVTVHLGHQGPMAPPPIRFAPDVAVPQRPGDAVVYLGQKVEHWRDQFHGLHFGQLFLNYVRADGPHAAHAYDGRTEAFPPALRAAGGRAGTRIGEPSAVPDERR